MQAGDGDRWQVGEVLFDLYEIREFLGAGDFGAVYRAHHYGWQTDIVIKVPRACLVASAEQGDRLEQEAQAWVNLGLHPHIVSCYYLRRWQGIPLLICDDRPGGRLQDWGQDGRLYRGGAEATLKRLLDVSIQMAWGLDYAHEQGLLHQDLKPTQILLTPPSLAQITDFGLAKAKLRAALPLSPYQAPEQRQGRALSRRSDLWSWARLVLELFQGESSGLGFSPPPAEVRPTLPVPVAQVLRTCLQADPEQRPYSLQEVATQLVQLYGEVTGDRYPRSGPGVAPEPADRLNNQALALLDQGQAEAAVRCWRQAHQHQPHHPEATYNCGLWLWRSAQISDLTLVRELEKARPASPDWRYAYLLSLVHLERDDCEAAIAQLETISSPPAPVQAALAWAQARQPEAQQARQLFPDREQAVNAVCFSADGRYALAGREDGMLALWDQQTQQYHAFGGFVKEAVQAVAIAPGTNYAISTSAATLRLWSLLTGQCLAEFNLQVRWEAPSRPELASLEAGTLFTVSPPRPRAPSRESGRLPAVGSQQLSADGRYALTRQPAALVLQELATGRVLYTCRPQGTPLYVTPEGRYGLGLEGEPQLWDLTTGEMRQRFSGHRGEVTAIALLPEGRRCLTCGSDRQIKLWSLASGRCQGTLKSPLASLRAIAVSPEGRRALVGGQGWQLWDLSRGRCLRTGVEAAAVRAIAISPDGSQALIGGQGWQLWSLAPSPYTAPYSLNRAQPSEALLSTRDRYDQALHQAQAALQAGDLGRARQALAAARAQPGLSREPQALALWQQLYSSLPRAGLREAWEVATLSGHQGYITALAISADGKTLLSGGSDNQLRLWPLPQGPTVQTLAGYFRGTVNAVGLGAEGRYALSGSNRGSLKLWELSSGYCLHTLDRKGNTPAISFDPEGRYALVGSNTGTITLWELATGDSPRSLNGHQAPIRALCFSPEGRCALSGDAGGNGQPALLILWDLASGRRLQTVAAHAEAITAVSFSPDGRYALSGSADGTLNLWATGVGRVLRTLRGHREPITAACFSPDGRYVFSSSEDHTLRLWEVATGRCLYCFEGHVTAVNAIALSPDSRYLVSGSNDGHCKVWLLDWELGAQPQAAAEAPEQDYLTNLLRLHGAESPSAQPTPSPRTPRPQPLTHPAHPWSFLTLLGVLAWAGMAAAVEVFAPGALNAALLAIGMAILVASFFFGRQAGNPTVQLGSLFGVLVLAIVALTAAREDLSLAVAALVGALVAVVGTGAILGLAAPNPVSELPGIRACRWLKLKLGAPLTLAVLLVPVLAGMGLELALNQGRLHPLVICIALVIALPGFALWGWQRRTRARPAWLQTGAIALLVLLATFKWSLPSSLGLTTPSICQSPAAAQIYLTRGGRANARVRLETQSLPLLHCALQTGQTEIAQKLLAAGAHVDEVSDSGVTPLHLAVEQDDLATVTALLARAAAPNATTDARLTPLHLAQSEAVAEALLAAGVEVDAITADYGTPLHTAVVGQHLAVVKRLLAAGADPNARCRNCAATTPLHAAVQGQQPELVELLLAAGSEVNARDRQGRTPLSWARQANQAALIQLLQSHGAQD